MRHEAPLPHDISPGSWLGPRRDWAAEAQAGVGSMISRVKGCTCSSSLHYPQAQGSE